MKWLFWALAFQMGSPGGGETQAIALDPRDPNVIYAGAAKGLCKTAKGGRDNWPSMGLESLSPRAIALDPANPDIVFAGTHEMGVYVSLNGGETWEPRNNGLTYLDIRALVFDGTALLAGTDGGGVFRTTSRGDSWQQINRGLIDKTVRTLLVDGGTIYAGTWHGVYWSRDHGEHWETNPAGLYDVDVTALAAYKGTLYAATNPRGVWRSTDGGVTWTPGEKPLTEHLMSMAIDPSNGDVYVGTRAGVWRSADGARSFTRAGLAWSNSAWTLVFDARTTPPTLYYGGVGGVLKTSNGGKWWDVTGPVRP